MSVSFYPSMNENVPHVLTCLCGQWVSDVYPDRQAAHEARGSWVIACDDPYCGDYAMLEPAEAEPSVNLSNSNADEFLDYLGISVGDPFEERCVGSLQAEDMYARAQMALALVPEDTGLITMPVENFIYCGRSADYMQTRLEQLSEVCAWAMTHHRTITWA